MTRAVLLRAAPLVALRYALGPRSRPSRDPAHAGNQGHLHLEVQGYLCGVVRVPYRLLGEDRGGQEDTFRVPPEQGDDGWGHAGYSPHSPSTPSSSSPEHDRTSGEEGWHVFHDEAQGEPHAGGGGGEPPPAVLR